MQEGGREDPCLRRFLARGEGGGSITLEKSNIECLLGCLASFYDPYPTYGILGARDLLFN